MTLLIAILIVWVVLIPVAVLAVAAAIRRRRSARTTVADRDPSDSPDSWSDISVELDPRARIGSR